MTTVDVHPEIDALRELVPTFALTREALATIRGARAEQFAALAPPLSDAVERVDHVVTDAPHVTVRVHTPKHLREPAPCLYSIHGGGYVLGSYEMDDAKFDQLCPRLGCIGVSVEYRLAPETPYPGPLEDCYAGLLWTFAHAPELHIDTSRVGITGVSAGGGLSAALALLVRDRGEVIPAFQLLECPMIDDRQVTPSSQYDDLLIWSREANTFGWECYLGELYGGDTVPAYAAAARADDLAGLPEAYVITGGADGFRDEDIAYATRLGQAGVTTDLTVIAGAPHGAQMFQGTVPARRWARAVAEWLEPRLSNTGD
jgi:acetyl esterase/lipase